ncbi:DUF1684 domain-containing protein [Leifsonia sp. A12D58]|uniref:DUF1684 domain-containing protein n=1 Tax=Leifsonia sp. A12D58 TaxID=3397674 RepID=UPI0039E0FC1B
MTSSTSEAHAPAAVIDAARESWTAWRAHRLESLVSPTGNLSLVSTRWFENDAESLDDVIAALPAQKSATTVATELTRTNITTGQPEHGIRLWDRASDSIQNFETVTVSEFDPSWVIEAAFTPVDSGRTVAFEHIRDNGGTRDLVVPGDITFTLDGIDYSFSAFDDGGTLLLVFGDATNGAEDESASYEAGRFLFVHRVDDSDTVILDFNQAFVPPCGFSIHYNCPLPPRNNRFAFAVEAGEKVVIFRDGYSLYTY